MWWGEFHLALVLLTLAISAIGHLKDQFISAAGLLLWWFIINAIWQLGVPAAPWTALFGVLFAGVYLTAYGRTGAMVYLFVAGHFAVIEVVCALASVVGHNLFMTFRGAVFASACLTVALTWRQAHHKDGNNNRA